METITRKDGKTLQAYVSATNAGKPCILVLQEWWGVNEQMKKRTLKFEAAGFRTILPDLYHGKSTTIGNRDEAKHLHASLDWSEALLDLQACIEYALSTGSAKVGVTGYCMGGALAIAAATQLSDITAIVPFYGLPPLDTYDISLIKCPIQGHFGEKDDWCNPPKVEEELTSKLSPLTDAEIIIYPGMGHAFANELRPEVYNALATEISHDRTMVFFGKHLF